MDTIKTVEEQASDAPSRDASAEADQQVNSMAAETASTIEPAMEDDALTGATIEEIVVDEIDTLDQPAEPPVEAVEYEAVGGETVEPSVVEQAVAVVADDHDDAAEIEAEPVAEFDFETTSEEDQQAESSKSAMADLVDDFAFKPLKAGETRDGIIVSVSPAEILVDVGAKSEGFVLQREMERHGREYAETYSVGDSVVVYVVRPEDRDGNVVLSLARAQQERDWREAERLQETAESFESLVIGHNRGGVICRVGKVRGFVPASQLVSKPEIKPDTDEENRWAGLVGETLWLKVVEMDRKRNRLILSERLAMRDRRRGRKDELLGELKKGDVRTGRVSSLAKFGAFVDLGGADGLIHLSELSWSRVNHPSEVVSVGQNVEVYVLNVDRDRKRIGLSLRRLKPEPWSVVHEKYAVGQIVQGVITKLANFGAFARVDGTLEGLIHISELANHRVTHPKEVVKEGEEHRLRIVRIDPARKRMGLSLKRVEDEAYAEVDWRAEEIEDEVDEQWEDLEEFDD